MKTVLTVAESKVVRSMVARGLSVFRCRSIEAVNGSEVVEAVRRHSPDLVLLDATLPGMGGREVLAALRGDGETARVPVILLTDREGPDVDREIAECGAFGYVVKPFQLRALALEVGRVLGSPDAVASRQNTPARRG